ncbi:MAG: serine/threonine protein kinase [Planctomycetota bacterium]
MSHAPYPGDGSGQYGHGQGHGQGHGHGHGQGHGQGQGHVQGHSQAGHSQAGHSQAGQQQGWANYQGQQGGWGNYESYAVYGYQSGAYGQYASHAGYGHHAQQQQPARAADTPQGTPFGRYVLVSELGRGGMGVVYRAYQSELKRHCALKVLHGADGERLVHEGQAVAKLGKHPNIVSVFDAGLVNGTAYIAMELVKGTPLDELLQKNGPMPEEQLLQIGYKTALALHHAHMENLVHRDMKPANIILDKKGEPHVLDFGLAKDVVEGDTQYQGLVVGTPQFMPPEQFNSGGQVDGRADVYSLGAALYQLACGSVPFDGGMKEIMVKLLTEEPDSLRSRADVTRDFDAVIGKAMEKDPRDRYQTGLEMAEDLSRVIRGEPPEGRKLGPIGRTLRRIQRHPGLITAAVLLALFTGAAGFYIKQQEGERERLWEGLTRQIVYLTANEAQTLLAPAVPLLTELEEFAERGVMPIDDPHGALKTDLAIRFAARELDWLTWVDAGDECLFTGVTRRGEQIVVNTSKVTGPGEEDGWELEEEFRPDGKFVQLTRHKTHFDGREEIEMVFATDELFDGPLWTDPTTWEVEESQGGGLESGISCIAAIRRGDQLLGAFTADFKLDSLSKFLREETKFDGTTSYLLTEEGSVFARSSETESGNDALASAIKALPGGLAGLTPGKPVSVRYQHGEESYSAALSSFVLPGGLVWTTAVVAPAAALLGDVQKQRRWIYTIALAGLSILVIGVLLVILRERQKVRRTMKTFAGLEQPAAS